MHAGSAIIRDVTAIDGDGVRRGVDVHIASGRISRIASPDASTSSDTVGPPDAAVVEGAGRLLLPGFVDAHSHAGALLERPDVQLALLRQGVTTVVAGQDGVGWAPGDGAYASEYFAAIDGPHTRYRGGGVGALLDAHTGTSPLNLAYLVPAGTVRFSVLGRTERAPNAGELDEMVRIVAQELSSGAVGVSTGLDYVPGIFAATDELAALARPAAAAQAIVVSHMRGGYESGSARGVAELAAIAHKTGVPVHISHFHAPPSVVESLMEDLRRSEVDASFDAYPYARGCSLLAMPLLPSSLTAQATDDIVSALRSPERDRLLSEWFPTIQEYPSLGPHWPAALTLAHIAAPEHAWAHGLTLEQAAHRSGVSAPEFALDLLADSRLEVSVVMAVPGERPDADLARILRHPSAMAGSDGIFIGSHPHPRARGTFAKVLSLLTRGTNSVPWPHLAEVTSARAVERFALGRRGCVAVGAVADLVLVEPHDVRDHATYERPLELAQGIDDAFVAGVQVLRDGRLTGALPGRGLRRAARPSPSDP